MINCHTHIFNVKCAPDKFYGPPIAGMLSRFPGSARRIAKLLRIVWPFASHDMLERYANMLEVGVERRQGDILNRMLNAYVDFPNPRIVALTLDMDHMGAGRAVNDYITQLNEVAELKTHYLDQLIAFFCVDPRRPNVLQLLKDHVLTKGFTGIKLYPALGFFPFDPRLRPIYQFAIEHDLPILTHCDIGGIYFRGPLSGEQIVPASMNPTIPRRNLTPHVTLKRQQYKDFFTDPLNFHDVLSMPEFDKLKICFAHYGGSEMISGKAKSPTGNNWYTSIKNLMGKYPNVYTDISYTLHNTSSAVRTPIMADIGHATLGERILFGTDFYMTVREKEEKRLINDFRGKYGISNQEFDRIAMENPSRFLSTKFFTI